MSDIRVNIAQRRVRVEMRNGTSWNGVSGKPVEFPPEDHTHVVDEITDFPDTMPPSAHTHPATQVTADAFQTPVFANPLNLDATSHKDFKCGTITGNTTVNLNNASDGDSGVIELIMDATGGYTVTLGTMFVTKIGTNDIDAAASKMNYVFWFCDNASGELTYTIQTV